MTDPSVAKRDPWHGQSHVRSASFHATAHPMCVHTADRTMTAPVGSRYAATRAISGATLLRPGFQALMRDALRHEFDAVLAESLDRFSRDQEDTARLFKRLTFVGVRIEKNLDAVLI